MLLVLLTVSTLLLGCAEEVETSRIIRNVKEERHYTKHVDEYLIIEYSWDNGTAWLVNFQPEGTTDNIILIKDGLKQLEEWFDWRLEIQSAGIRIIALEIADSGTFEFRDKKGDLVLVAHLEMKKKKDDDPPPPPLLLVYISVAFVLGGLVVCWFTRNMKCWKKCCKCCKRNKSAPRTAAPPAAHYHVQHHPVSVFVTASPSQIDSSGESAPAASNVLSSDSDPQLESALPSSQPLSSDSAPSDVYTSEKLHSVLKIQ